jgi:hypothetical protein
MYNQQLLSLLNTDVYWWSVNSIALVCFSVEALVAIDMRISKNAWLHYLISSGSKFGTSILLFISNFSHWSSMQAAWQR